MPAPPPGSDRHLGVDLGGTFIKWAVVLRDGTTWKVVERERTPTLGQDGPDAVVGQLISVARAARSRHPDVSTLGIGVPGPYDPASGTTRDLTNFPGDWAGRQLANEVGTSVGLRTYLINDARAFGLAELRIGAGRGASSMVGVTLGTGVGGVVAIGGNVYQGHDGSAGEIGHQTVDRDGPPCNCGSHGCLEAFVRSDRIAEACGAATVEEAVARARSGDVAALAGLASVGRYLGIGLANIITLVTPDRVVIGGGGADALDLLLPSIHGEIEARVRMTSLDAVEIVTAELGIWAGAIGAAIHGAEAAPQQP